MALVPKILTPTKKSEVILPRLPATPTITTENNPMPQTEALVQMITAQIRTIRKIAEQSIITPNQDQQQFVAPQFERRKKRREKLSWRQVERFGDRNVNKLIPMGVLAGIIASIDYGEVINFLKNVVKDYLVGKEGLLPEPIRNFVRLFTEDEENNPYKTFKTFTESIDQAIEPLTSNEQQLQEVAGVIEEQQEKLAQLQSKVNDALQKVKIFSRDVIEPEQQPAPVETRPVQTEQQGRVVTESGGELRTEQPPAPVVTRPVPTQRQPISSLPGVNNMDTEPLAANISKFESGKRGYNAYNKGTVGNRIIGQDKQIDFSTMTIEEYFRRAALPINDPDKLFAVGKYQIIPDTMRDAVRKLGLNPKTTYLTPEVQDRIFSEFLIGSKRPNVAAYLSGKSNNIDAAVMDLAKEFASVGVPYDTKGSKGQPIKKGQSFYSGVL